MDKCKIVKRLEYCAENKCDICQEENGSGFPWIDGRCYGFTERLYDTLALLKAQEQEIEDLKQEIEGHKDNLRETLDEMMRYADELKAQEPIIISLRDVVCADVGSVVWLETYYDGKTGIEPFLVCIDFTQKPVIINGWDSFYNISEQELNDDIVNSFYDEFTVRKFRFWSSKPTDEQRKAVKWE